MDDKGNEGSTANQPNIAQDPRQATASGRINKTSQQELVEVKVRLCPKLRQQNRKMSFGDQRQSQQRLQDASATILEAVVEARADHGPMPHPCFVFFSEIVDVLRAKETIEWGKLGMLLHLVEPLMML